MWSRKLQEYSGLYKEIQRSFRGCFKEFNDVSRQGQLCTKSFSWFQRCFKDGLMKLQSCFHSASLILAEVFQEGFKYVSGRLGLSWGGFKSIFKQSLSFLDRSSKHCQRLQECLESVSRKLFVEVATFFKQSLGLLNKI